MGKARAIVLVLGLALLPWAAQAEEEEKDDGGGFARPGWYLGVGGAAGINFFEDEIHDALASVGLDGDVKTTAGVNARGGYRFASWVALEAMYEWMPRFRVEASADAPGGPDVTLGSALFDYTTHTFTLNAKFVVPTWRFQPYLLLGLGGQYYVADAGAEILGTGLDLSEKGWAIAGRPGVGLDIYITRNLVLNAEVSGVLATANPSTIPNIGDMFYISAGGGLQWRF
jgi:hypothetical protein